MMSKLSVLALGLFLMGCNETPNDHDHDGGEHGHAGEHAEGADHDGDGHEGGAEHAEGDGHDSDGAEHHDADGAGHDGDGEEHGSLDDGAENAKLASARPEVRYYLISEQ